MPKVEIYSKTTCTYCDHAKQLFDEKSVTYTEIRIDQDPSKIDEMLKRCDGRRSVPQILINDQAIGGFEKSIQTLV